ncbi:MAG: PfkB family carbohydrate kinase [Victivallaceae bacterium]|nr:PfkB family carbohydrate kinase [Victivallaceae bacterium]
MSFEELKRAVFNFGKGRVAVVGDLMLDAYTFGSARRISPEAPVLILDTERESCCLGGAGNVMRNLMTLGGCALAYGVLGNDADGELVRKMLTGYGIDHAMVLGDPARRTTRKQRVLAANQQLIRIDTEDTFALDAEISRTVFNALKEAIEQKRVDAVLFEDYGKGMLSHEFVSGIAAAAKEAGIITALDPKPGNLAPVRGLTVMKPNRVEACAMSGLGSDAPLNEVAAKIMAEWSPEILLISLAAQGLAIFRPGMKPMVIPTRAREVFDVSGAGDTLIGTYTLALASGARPETAAMLANCASGVVVGKVGTVTVTRDELLEAIEKE